MKKIILFFMIVMMPMNAFAKVKIVASLPVFGAIAQEVGGDRVEITSLAKPGQDPHFLDAKPTYVVALSQADLLLQGGLELEIGWLPVLMTQSHNPKIQKGQVGYLEASKGIRILEIPSAVDRSMGDVHPEGNPHYWLDPRNGILIASNIAERLGQLDPANASFYQDRFNVFRREFSEKIKTWENIIQKLRGNKMMTYHQSFSYFLDWAKLQSVGQIEPKPGIPPTPSHLLSLIDLLKKDSISFILVEDYYDARPAQELSKKTNVPVLIVPTSSGGRYEELFDTLIQKMRSLP